MKDPEPAALACRERFGSGWGRHRRVVEGTLGRLLSHERLALRYDPPR